MDSDLELTNENYLSNLNEMGLSPLNFKLSGGRNDIMYNMTILLKDGYLLYYPVYNFFSIGGAQTLKFTNAKSIYSKAIDSVISLLPDDRINIIASCIITDEDEDTLGITLKLLFNNYFDADTLSGSLTILDNTSEIGALLTSATKVDTLKIIAKNVFIGISNPNYLISVSLHSNNYFTTTFSILKIIPFSNYSKFIEISALEMNAYNGVEIYVLMENSNQEHVLLKTKHNNTTMTHPGPLTTCLTSVNVFNNQEYCVLECLSNQVSDTSSNYCVDCPTGTYSLNNACVNMETCFNSSGNARKSGECYFGKPEHFWRMVIDNFKKNVNTTGYDAQFNCIFFSKKVYVNNKCIQCDLIPSSYSASSYLVKQGLTCLDNCYEGYKIIYDDCGYLN